MSGLSLELLSRKSHHTQISQYSRPTPIPVFRAREYFSFLRSFFIRIRGNQPLISALNTSTNGFVTSKTAGYQTVGERKSNIPTKNANPSAA